MNASAVRPARANGAPKFTAKLREGFGPILAELVCDTDYGLLDEGAPWFRRLKTRRDRDGARAALVYMFRHAEAAGFDLAAAGVELRKRDQDDDRVGAVRDGYMTIAVDRGTHVEVRR